MRDVMELAQTSGYKIPCNPPNPTRANQQPYNKLGRPSQSKSAGSSKKIQQPVGDNNFMDMLLSNESMASPLISSVRYIEPFWATIKIREQLMCYPESSHVMPSLGQV